MCSGCGAVAIQAPHPIVGIGWDQETNAFAAFPVCDPCWRHPEHRAVKLKMHFFPRDQEAIALAAAGSENLG